MKKTTGEKVYDRIKSEIVSLGPDDSRFIKEQELADKYGVSRTPVRDALQRLCEEGMITKYPKKGYLVNTNSDGLLLEREQTRLLLETGIVRYIIFNVPDDKIKSLYSLCNTPPSDRESYLRANRDFHLALADCLNNKTLTNILTDLVADHAQHFMDYQCGNITEPFGATDIRHRMILQSILERNVDKAIQAVENDIMGYQTRKKKMEIERQRAQKTYE